LCSFGGSWKRKAKGYTKEVVETLNKDQVGAKTLLNSTISHEYRFNSACAPKPTAIAIAIARTSLIVVIVPGYLDGRFQ